MYMSTGIYRHDNENKLYQCAEHREVSLFGLPKHSKAVLHHDS